MLDKPKRRPIANESQPPLLVAGVALAGYLLIFLLFLAYFKDIRNFIVIGKPFITLSDKSSVIRPDPDYNYDKNGVGYDGQFAYYIALDPPNARYYLDQVRYRYTRILYPMAVRAVGLGQRDFIPAAMVMVNLLAISGGTWAIAAWCSRRKLSPWFGLVYAFYVGQVMAFERSLNEPLAYALVAIGIYLLERLPEHPLVAAAVFSLAGLGRESTLIFPILYGLLMLFEDTSSISLTSRFLRSILFLTVAMVPSAAWQVFLELWLGSTGWGQGIGLFRLPLSGLYSLYPLGLTTLQVVEVVIVPGLICLIIGLQTLLRDPPSRRRVELWALVLNSVLFVTLLYPDPLFELYAAGRISIPVVLSAILSLSVVRSRWWFYSCSALWLTSTISHVTNPILELIHGILGNPG